MNDLYYQKYLKYKQKYLELQKLQQKIQKGGWSIYIVKDLLETPGNYDFITLDDKENLKKYIENNNIKEIGKLKKTIEDKFTKTYDTAIKRQEITKKITDILSKQKEKRDTRKERADTMREKYGLKPPSPDSGSASASASPMTRRRELVIIEPLLVEDTTVPVASSAIPRPDILESSKPTKKSSLPHELERPKSISPAEKIIQEIGKEVETDLKGKDISTLENKYPFIRDIADFRHQYSYIFNKIMLIKIKENKEFDKIDKEYYIDLYQLLIEIDFILLKEDSDPDYLAKIQVLNTKIQAIQLTYQIERQKEIQREIQEQIKKQQYTLRQREDTVAEQEKLLNAIKVLAEKKHGMNILGTQSKETLKQINELLNIESDDSPVTPDELSGINVAETELQLERALSHNEEQVVVINRELETVNDVDAKAEILNQTERLELYKDIIKQNIIEQQKKYKKIDRKTPEVDAKYKRKLDRMNTALEIIEGQMIQLNKFARLLNRNDKEYADKIKKIQEECNLRNYDNFQYIYANEKIKNAITRVPVKDDIISGIDKIMEELATNKSQERIQQKLGRMLSEPNTL